MNNKLIAALGLTGVMLLFCVGCGDASTTTTITLTENKISIEGTGAIYDGNVVTITSAGCYEISGTLSEGQIKVDTENETDKVELVLDGVNLFNTTESAIFEDQAGQVTITLAKESENRISSGIESMYREALEEAKAGTSDTGNTSEAVESDETTQNTNQESEESAEQQDTIEETTDGGNETAKEDRAAATQEIATATKAAIYVKDGLTVSGEGSLEVNGYLNNGIQAKGDLEIQSGTITVLASNDGIKSGANVAISGGTVTTTTVGDGIYASDSLTISDGTFQIKTGEGAGETTDMEEIMPEDTASDKETTTKKPANGTEKENTETTTEKPANDTQKGNTENEADTNKWIAHGTDGEHRGQRQDFSPEDFNETSSQDSDVSQKGIKSENTLTISGGDFTFDTTDDAVHSNDVVVINDGTMEIATVGKAIHADNSLTVSNGIINIAQCKEGLEAIEIVVDGGDIDVTASDDGFNASGGTSSLGMRGGMGNSDTNGTTDTENGTKEASADPMITINGGDIYINADGDGIDSNESIYINGGNICIDGPANSGNSAIDIGTENNGICQISGGTVVGIGYSGMAEGMDSSSTQCSFMYVFEDTVSAGTEIVVSDGDGNQLVAVTTVKNCDSIIFSSEELSQGGTYTITAEDQSGEITLEEIYTTNSTSSGMFDGHGGGMKRNDTKTKGDRPQMPNGEAPNGHQPQMPDRGAPSGDQPKMSDGRAFNEQTTSSV